MSVLRKLEPLLKLIPGVSRPVARVSFYERMKWTALILFIYFILMQTRIFGLQKGAVDYFEHVRAILGGRGDSIVSLGIGPIVTSSIVMQLFVGAKLIGLDLSNTKDRAIFQSTQKLLAMVFCVVEAIPQVYLGMFQPEPTLGISLSMLQSIILLQVAMGGILIIYMDEVVSKWGIGSGVGLFIVAGVAQNIMVGAFNPVPETPGAPTPGRVYQLINSIVTGEAVNPSVVVYPLLGVLIVFCIVVYFESVRVEVPLAYTQYGIRGRYPIKLLYTSNIPVILGSALLWNIQLWGMVFQRTGYPILGEFDIARNRPLSGVVYYLYPVQGVDMVFEDPIRAMCYLIAMVAFAAMFAIFWVETTNMGPKAVAKQLQQTGLQIPGFRRDPRVIERVLERYIPTVTIIGGAAIGLLAAGADFLGALGGGTGILLTVGILYRLYEDMASHYVMEMQPAIRRFFE